MVEIELTKGKVAIVDDEDYGLIVGFSWHYCGGYATAKKKSKETNRFYHVCMNRLILGVEDSRFVVDHINGDKLDNRRSNLRVCTQAQNRRNTKCHQGSAVNYKGVSINKGKYVAVIGVGYKVFHIGSFNTAAEAAKAYDYEAVKLHGEFANINFPETRHVVQNILNNTLFQNATR